MRNFKGFSRAVRQEIGRLSTLIKQMEFKMTRLPSYVKKRTREELMELKRLKEAVARKATDMRNKGKQHPAVIQSVREEIAILHQRCRQLRMQRL